MNRAATFDESWHRVEGRKVRLRPGVDIFPQRYRGRRWYVVRDLLGNRFFRVQPPAYRFICELERSGTVGEAWDRCLDASPEEAPGQGEVVQLLSQLHQSGLLRSDLEGDVASLFSAKEKEDRSRVKQQWSSLLFIRIPLFNPDRFLQRTLPLVSWMISRVGFVAWLIMLGFGAKAIAENWDQFRVESGDLLGASNLPWLYGAMIVIKGLHEYAHGYFCRKYGGEVPQMGIMLLLMNPLPFVDASSSWAFRQKSRRILVAAAGMIMEVFLASVAAIIWANTAEGLAHTVAYNAIIIASVGTLLFNLNPLLRFDGYHILSDILEVPNLQQRASRTSLYLIERYLFRLPKSVNPAETNTETSWLVFYFVAAFIYRIILLTGILLLVSHWFYAVGVILAVVFGFIWLVLPVVKACRYLCASPKLEARRGFAIGLCSCIIGGIMACLALIPLPSHFRASGTIRSDPYSGVFAGTSGVLSEILIPSGKMVTKGQALAMMTSFELEKELQFVKLDLAKAMAQRRESLEADPVRYLSLDSYLAALDARLEKLAAQKRSLIIKAPVDGMWIAPELKVYSGATLQRGTELGVVQGGEVHYLAAEVRQADVARLFSGKIEKSGVKVRGLEGWTMAVFDLQAIPSDRSMEADGVRRPGGADRLDGVEASQKSQLSSEPFFEVRAFVVPDESCYLVHGQEGVARIDLPWEPLLPRWVRSIRQLFQRNYRI
tara:strand:- start:1234 stop:3387 length:2154 start_codon:yes stop_codon:yes gene_type:complete